MNDGEGRVVVVTGGGTGIGAAISRNFAERGYRVAIGQRQQATADELAGVLASETHGDVIGVGADLATAAGCAHLIADAIAQFGRIDVLVNNAAVTGPPAVGAFVGFPDEQLDAVIDVNLKAPFRCARAAVRDMIARDEPGVVVNVGSVAGFAPQTRTAAYSATKAGIVMLTRALAVELAEHRIRVVGVAPGDIEVGRAARAEDFVDPWARGTPLPRRGVPSDIAAAVAFLAGDDAAFITGETLIVDGGWLAT
ncbi:UNVERIFIED_CONTAM: SDR family oxidoreductase [Microbacterium sp. SLM126]